MRSDFRKTKQVNLDVNMGTDVTDNKNINPLGETNGKLLHIRNPMEIVWRNVTLFGALHISAFYAMVLIPHAHALTLIWVFLLYVLSLLGTTAGAHRLWAHRSYRAKLPLRVLLALLNCIAFQNDIYEWSRDHRVHHKYSETNADPHNAKRGFFFSHIGWLLVKKHPDVKSKGQTINMSDLRKDYVVMFQKKYYKPLVGVCCFILPTMVPWYYWNETWWNVCFLAVNLRYCLSLNVTWLVNSAAHMWGNRPYDATINPVQNAGVSVLGMGEGFHNYHHTFPRDYSTSELGWKMNVTTAFIDIMALVGLAYDRFSVPKEVVLDRKRRTGDGTDWQLEANYC